jgi:Fic family protein
MAKPVRHHLGKFPPKHVDWERLIPLIGPANAALARYDGLLSAIPNADVLLSPLPMQEAVLSSRIEGTQATMSEVLEFEAGGLPENADPKKVEDIREILNYRRAMAAAVDQLQTLPLCQRVIKHIHAILLDGVRGHDKARGKYKPIQNYIGSIGCSIDGAKFVPIAPEQVVEGMGQWEKYLHAKSPDSLVQLAIAHAEFEALHPFLDGNGRVGRMLIPLFLLERKLLQAPVFYLSEYLEANRREYYDRLLAVSSNDDWTGWCEFFLKAVSEHAAKNQQKARQILDLYQTKKEWLAKAIPSRHSVTALDFVFKRPIFNSTEFVETSGIPEATARRMLSSLVGAALIRVLRDASGRRPTIYAFFDLLNIAEGRKVL